MNSVWGPGTGTGPRGVDIMCDSADASADEAAAFVPSTNGVVAIAGRTALTADFVPSTNQGAAGTSRGRPDGLASPGDGAALGASRSGAGPGPPMNATRRVKSRPVLTWWRRFVGGTTTSTATRARLGPAERRLGSETGPDYATATLVVAAPRACSSPRRSSFQPPSRPMNSWRSSSLNWPAISKRMMRSASNGVEAFL